MANSEIRYHTVARNKNPLDEAFLDLKKKQKNPSPPTSEADNILGDGTLSAENFKAPLVASEVTYKCRCHLNGLF